MASVKDMKVEKNVKKKGKQKVVIEGIEPLNFKKLFAFCDPSKEHFDDSSTLASTPSLHRPDLTPQCPPTTMTETTEKPRSLPTMEDDDGKEKASTHTETTTTPQNTATTTTTTTTRELQPELKATHHDSKLRIRRGIEVAIFAVLVVWGTIVALHKLEGKVDINVIVDSEFISSERKKLINIFHKRNGANDGGGVTSSPISISAKTKKPINEVTKEAGESVADAPSTTTTTTTTKTKTKPNEEKESDGVPEPNDLPNTLDINNKKVNEDVDSFDEVVESETVGTDPELVPKAEEEYVDADIRSDL